MHRLLWKEWGEGLVTLRRLCFSPLHLSVGRAWSSEANPPGTGHFLPSSKTPPLKVRGSQQPTLTHLPSPGARTALLQGSPLIVGVASASVSNSVSDHPEAPTST